jgi:hypothetical protein
VGLNHAGHLVDKRDGARGVKEHVDEADLLPRHRHVFQKLVDGMRRKLEGAQVHALVVSELSARHVPMVLHNLPYHLRRHFLLPRLCCTRLLAGCPLPFAQSGPFLRLQAQVKGGFVHRMLPTLPRNAPAFTRGGSGVSPWWVDMGAAANLMTACATPSRRPIHCYSQLRPSFAPTQRKSHARFWWPGLYAPDLTGRSDDVWDNKICLGAS